METEKLGDNDFYFVEAIGFAISSIGHLESEGGGMANSSGHLISLGSLLQKLAIEGKQKFDYQQFEQSKNENQLTTQNQ